jgi:hypothetical protein
MCADLISSNFTYLIQRLVMNLRILNFLKFILCYDGSHCYVLDWHLLNDAT